MCQLASGPVCVGHWLLDQHFAQRDGERENSIVGLLRATWRGGGGTCRSLFPLCYLYFFFPFPSFNCVRFSLALGYFQSFFFFSRSFLLYNPSFCKFLAAWNQKLRQLFFKIQLRAAAESASFTSACQIQPHLEPGEKKKKKTEEEGRRFKTHFNIAWNLSKTSPWCKCAANQ